MFEAEYLTQSGPLTYRSHQLSTSGDGADRERITLQIQDDAAALVLHGNGTGPIDAAVRALDLAIDVVGYHEHSCGSGSDAMAIAYVQISVGRGMELFGVGRHSNIITASLLALVSGVNRALRSGMLTRQVRASSTG